MRISPAFRTSYPTLAAWIEVNLLKIKLKPKVWKAFLRYSELKEPYATWSITPGYNPDIYAKLMPGSNGQFIGAKYPNRVFLAKSMCEKFENVDFANPKMHMLIESTLLHEMVHWGDWKDGVDQVGEEGTAFEKAAYGKDIDGVW